MKKYIGVICIILLSLVIYGCDNNATDVSDDAIKVYYINSKTSALESVNYIPEARNPEGTVHELIRELRAEPENEIYKKAIPDNIRISDIVFSDNSLTLNFEQNYSSLELITEVILRAAVVRTLIQVDGIEYIEFYVAGQPLMDPNGVVGLMTNEDFIESTGAETDYNVTLYFANETGEVLVETSSSIHYTGTGSIEEMVINQLINGPTQTGMYNTIPEGTTLLNISTKDGFCILDFNEVFLKELAPINDEVSLSPEVTIYSIVNTLVELPGINKVQFLINGAPQDKFRGDIVLSKTFERNLEIIEGSK